MPVPYTFANQIGNIALSELDANFANVSAAVATAATVTASAQPAITSVGQLVTLGVLGNISSALGGVYAPGFYYPNGVSILNGLDASAYGNANVAAFLPGYDGSLISLSGNVTTTAAVNAANAVFSSTVTAQTITATTGNITASNGNIYAARNITGQTLTSQGSITGTTITAISGNITASSGNIVGVNITTTGNVIASGRLQASSVTASGTIQGSDLYSTALLRAATLTISGDGTVSGNLTVSSRVNLPADINISATANTAVDTTISHKLPVTINGTVYYIALTSSV